MDQKAHIKEYQSKELNCWNCYPDSMNGRCRSIHSLTPSSIKSIASKSCKLAQRTNSIHRLRGVSHDRKIIPRISSREDNIVQSLFQTEKDILTKLEKEGKELEKEKEKVKKQNSEEYQKIVEKLIQSRRFCNKRRIQIQSLKNQLNLMLPDKSFTKVRAFKDRRIQQKLYNELFRNTKLSYFKEGHFK